MEVMKGFYFSLDSLLASSVMLAAFLMMLSQPVNNPQELENYKLDRVHLANIQEAQNWNSTYNSSDTVSSLLIFNYFNGSQQQAESICRNYFGINERYGVFVSNQTYRSKICGNIKVEKVDTLVSQTTITPEVKVNSTFIHPKHLTMVIHD